MESISITTTFDNDDGTTQVRMYSDMPSQFPAATANGAGSPVIGFARDGFPIFGPYNEHGALVTASALDECNGMLDSQGNYGYYLTPDPPFAPRCLRGETVGVFSYHTTDQACPADGVATTFFKQSDVLANCEQVVVFGDAPGCAGGTTSASRSLVGGSGLLCAFFLTAAASAWASTAKHLL